MQLRAVELLLFLTLWGTFAFFSHARPGWNVNSRLALTYAIVEQGTVRIDSYWQKDETSTEDVAVFGGHYYSDKIIGTSLLGIPAFAAVRGAEAICGDTFSPAARRYLVTLLSVGVLAAAAGVILFRLLLLFQLRWHEETAHRPWAALAITLTMFLGTQMLFYATLFMSYLPALFFLLCAMLVFERWRAGQDGSGREPGASFMLVRAGLLCGAALLCEYMAGIAVAGFGAYVLFHLRHRTRIWIMPAAATVALLPFLVYSVAVFGKPTIPYQYEHNDLFRAFMSRGLMGATTPSATVLWLITFHPFRGLFIHSPQLLAALAGLVALLRCRNARPVGVLVAAVTAGYLLFNSAYYMWWGGWSFGPRHLIPAIPFLAIAMLPAWRWLAGRLAILGSGVAGVFIHVIVNAVDPQFPDRLRGGLRLEELLYPDLRSVNYPWVFGRYVWRMFRMGELEPNAGMLLGLSGEASLLPLIAFWAVGGMLLWLVARRAPATGPRRPVQQ